MRKVFLLLLASVFIISGSAQNRRTNVRRPVQKNRTTNVAKKPAVDTKALADTLENLKHQITGLQMQLQLKKRPLTQQLSDGTVFKFVDCWQEDKSVIAKFDVCNPEGTRLKIKGRNRIGIVDDKQISITYIYQGEHHADESRIDLESGVHYNISIIMYVADDLAKVLNYLRIEDQNSESNVEFRELPIRKEKDEIKTIQDSVKLMKSYLKDLKRRDSIKPIQVKKLADGTTFELISCNYNGRDFVNPTIRIYNHSKDKDINYKTWNGLSANKYVIDGSKGERGYLYVGYDPCNSNKFTVEKNAYTNIIVQCYVGDKLPKMLDLLEFEDQTTHEKVTFKNVKIER